MSEVFWRTNFEIQLKNIPLEATGSLLVQYNQRLITSPEQNGHY